MRSMNSISLLLMMHVGGNWAALFTVGFDFGTVASGSFGSNQVSATTSGAGNDIIVGPITRGVGLTPLANNSYAAGWGSDAFTNTMTIDDAIANNQFFTFTVGTVAGELKTFIYALIDTCVSNRTINVAVLYHTIYILQYCSRLTRAVAVCIVNRSDQLHYNRQRRRAFRLCDRHRNGEYCYVVYILVTAASVVGDTCDSTTGELWRQHEYGCLAFR
jgi:hypothetical protein